MSVTNLRGETAKEISACGAVSGGAYFSNLSYTALPTWRRCRNSRRLKRRFQTWDLSPTFDAAEVDPAAYPASNMHWDKVHAEDPGFVLVNRYRTSTAMFLMPPREDMRKGRVKGAKVVSHGRTSLRRAPSISSSRSDTATTLLCI
jgi:hypothetical protein